MIAKRIDRKLENDNTYRKLALRICGHTKKNPNEKMLDSWAMCCESENFMDVLMEIAAVQALNTTATGRKTYYLLLSFHPQDEEKLVPENIREIEIKFSQALGYASHQRCCGVHKSTNSINNIHMHIAYNMINPESFKRHEPYRDFFILGQTCREVEAKYGLAVDNGLCTKQPLQKKSLIKQELGSK